MTKEEYKDLSDLEKFRLWRKTLDDSTMLDYVEDYILEDNANFDDLFYELEHIYGIDFLFKRLKELEKLEESEFINELA